VGGQQTSKLIRSFPQSRLHLCGKPIASLGFAWRHPVKDSFVKRQPFIELRLVTMEHFHDRLDDGPDVDNNIGVERQRFLKAVGDVSDYGIRR